MSKYALVGNLIQKCIYNNNYKNILSIGTYNFPLATEKMERFSMKNSIKFSNKYFDLVYCYDIFNDIRDYDYEIVCKEINRFSKEGIIETFSPLKIITLTKRDSEFVKWKINKNHITWTDYHTNTLCFMILDKKYDSENIFMNITNNIKNNSQIFYHNFYMWDLNNPINIKIYNYKNEEEYIKIFKEASYKSICNTELLMNFY